MQSTKSKRATNGTAATAASSAGVSKPRGRPPGRKRASPSTSAAALAALARENDGETEDEEYEVEAIQDDGVDGPTLTHKYLVKWVGYDTLTWEPGRHIPAAILQAYDASKRKKSSAAKNKRAAARGSATKSTAAVGGAKRGRKPGRKPKGAAGSGVAAVPAVAAETKTVPRPPPKERTPIVKKKAATGSGRRGRPPLKR